MISTSAYDGLGRRITKVVSNSGDLDMTYHFYYSGGEGQSIAEIRDGSELVLKQHVWATLANGYIDELLQTTANRDLFNNPSMDIPYPWGGGPWSDPLAAALYDSLHDANYNIQGLIEDATEGGNLVERYEYTPYGQRLVLRSSGGNDPLCHTPTFVSQRQASYIWTLGTPEELVAFPQPFGLNEFGHQGLYHDEETAPGGGAGATLIYNRARMLHTRLGRFTQRDPLGYVDGMSVYQYLQSKVLVSTDPWGLLTPDDFWDNWTEEERADWFKKFRNDFGSMISKSAKNNCVPEELLAAIIANEQLDYSSTENLFETAGFGDSVGPAQISVVTIDRENLWTDSEYALFNRSKLAKNSSLSIYKRAWLDDNNHNIDMAGRLLAKHLKKICKDATDGTISQSFSLHISQGCNVDDFCCAQDGGCDKLVAKDVPKCLIQALVAMWNNGPKITGVQDIRNDSPNAENHALWGGKLDGIFSPPSSAPQDSGVNQPY